MKHQWVAYVIVALLSIGAGVAIAGLPNNVPVDATIIPPTTTEAPEPTVPETTEPEPVETTEPEQTTTTTSTTTTTTEPPVETTEPEPGLPDPASVAVVAVNGSDIAGTASRMVDRLEGFGFTNAVPRDGTEIRELTWVYYEEGFDGTAAEIAEALDLLPDFIAPIGESPQVQDLPDAVDVIVYVGIDRS